MTSDHNEAILPFLMLLGATAVPINVAVQQKFTGNQVSMSSK